MLLPLALSWAAPVAYFSVTGAPFNVFQQGLVRGGSPMPAALSRYARARSEGARMLAADPYLGMKRADLPLNEELVALQVRGGATAVYNVASAHEHGHAMIIVSTMRVVGLLA